VIFQLHQAVFLQMLMYRTPGNLILDVHANDA